MGVFQCATICFSGLEVVTEMSLASEVCLKLQGTLWLWLFSSIKLANLKYIQSFSASTSSPPFWQETACSSQKMSVILK